ncbi:MAG TPA: RDD family protein [Candidatus Acidoferrales bacterium]|nr:RDD family protein [Candidatus Acidoferrales bacterium]
MAPASTSYSGTPTSATGAVYAPQLFYAGFWLRFVAYLIDTVILGIVYIVLFIVVIFASGVAAMLRNLPEHPTPDMFLRGAFIVAVLVLVAITTVITWLYYAWMESSPSQGTLGKMAMGLIVTDMQYRPISFARASGRFFAKFITGLIPLCIGYIMAGFTAKKQALHDMIASCLILRKI